MKHESTAPRAAGADALNSRLRSLPPVDSVLAQPEIADLLVRLPRELVTGAVRAALDVARDEILAGRSSDLELSSIARGAAARVAQALSPGLRPVINATGVILHTNLGRAPLSRSAIEAIRMTAGYSNLEFDLVHGERGSRYVHATRLLQSATGCEDALVVNNNAAALVLVLSALAAGREVVLSRGQAVEIGGGFRIPDIMAASGARLVEVGTTNRTYLADYESAAGPETAALMRVHASNFRLVGFTTSPAIHELAGLAQRLGILLIDDVGSGALIDPAGFGLAHEPLVQDSLRAGSDLVLFSGDKLLGGPQCGIIAGKASLVGTLRRHPLARALRVDKLTLSALEATLLHYVRGEAEREVPVWRMIAMPQESIRRRAEAWAADLNRSGTKCDVVKGESAIGGGSLPGECLPTWLLSVRAAGGDDIARSAAGHVAEELRRGEPAVVCRVDSGSLLLDPRTVLEDQDDNVLDALKRVFSGV